ncbi:hypothetical protein M8J76_015899 [Diaphorina citri]|nr:hypothetical protein M8J75_005465 [Diaphorina citri]KAI5745964.1 hypothetical protein M8J76_015899 [Diaphorina citri]
MDDSSKSRTYSGRYYRAGRRSRNRFLDKAESHATSSHGSSIIERRYNESFDSEIHRSRRKSNSRYMNNLSRPTDHYIFKPLALEVYHQHRRRSVEDDALRALQLAYYNEELRRLRRERRQNAEQEGNVEDIHLSRAERRSQWRERRMERKRQRMEERQRKLEERRNRD